MRRAKVIDRAHPEHPLVPRQGLACQRPTAACQWCEAFPTRRVEPLNVRCIAHPVSLRPPSDAPEPLANRHVATLPGPRYSRRPAARLAVARPHY